MDVTTSTKRNYIPYVPEIPLSKARVLKNQITALKGEMAKWKVKINKGMQLVADLRERKATSYARIDGARHALGPFNSALPHVILSIIFEFAAALPSPEHPNILLPDIAATYLLSRVCKQWRSIVLSTAFLWSRICHRDHGPHNRTNEFLYRSRNAPLHVELVLSRDMIETPDSGIRLLVPHINRWQTITLCGDEKCFDNVEVFLLKEQAGNLLSMSIRGIERSETYDTHRESALIPLSCRALRLNHLTISHVIVDVEQALAYPSLKSLYLLGVGLRFSDFDTLLGVLPKKLRILKLEAVDFKDEDKDEDEEGDEDDDEYDDEYEDDESEDDESEDDESDEEDDDFGTIKFQNLEELVCANFCPRSLGILLTRIRATDLQHLEICLRAGTIPFAPLSGGQLHFPSIESLILSSHVPSTTTDHYRDVMAARMFFSESFDALHEIHLEGSYLAPIFVEVIKREKDLCPNLWSLACSHVDTRKLREIILARERDKRPIKSIALIEPKADLNLDLLTARLNEVYIADDGYNPGARLNIV